MNSIIITGATSGIGFECAVHIVKMSTKEQIVIACRDQKSGEKTIDKIKQLTAHKNITSLPLDLESLQSVKEFRNLLAATGNNISVLINNASVQNVQKTKYAKDGFEETFGVNYLAPLYLTLLLPPFCTSDAHITFTASGTHDPKQKTGMPAPQFKEVQLMPYSEPGEDKSLALGQMQYTTSKLCNIMITYQLQEKLSKTDIHVNAFDPGFVPRTGLARNYPSFLKFISDYVLKILVLFVSNANTVKTSGDRLANLAYSQKYKESKGKYFEGEKEVASSEDSYNRNYWKILWDGSINLMGIQPTDTNISL